MQQSPATLCWVVIRVLAGLLERGECRLNALPLVFGDQAGKHLPEVRVLGARVDVLPAVSLEECGLDRPRLGLVDRAAALRRAVSPASWRAHSSSSRIACWLSSFQ